MSGWSLNSSAKALDANERRSLRDELLPDLARFSLRDPDREAQLRDLHWKAEEARAARYRTDVRLAAVLRMRTLLTDLVGRYYMARHASEDERRAYDRLVACEDLALREPSDTSDTSDTALAAVSSGASAPYPSLAAERLRLPIADSGAPLPDARRGRAPPAGHPARPTRPALQRATLGPRVGDARRGRQAAAPADPARRPRDGGDDPAGLASGDAPRPALIARDRTPLSSG